MKKMPSILVFAFIISTSMYSQWNVIDNLQNVKTIQIKNDSLIVATNNGVYYLDIESNISLLGKGDTLKNIYKIKVIRNTIYAASKETIYKYSLIENDWEPVFNPDKYLVDFYIVDSLYAITGGWEGLVKNYHNGSIIYHKWSDVLSTGGWFGSIEYYDNKFYIHRAFGNLDIISTVKGHLYVSSEDLKSNSLELWATELSELTENWLYAVFPCFAYECDNKGSLNWYDYKNNDSVKFIDSVNLNKISSHCMDVFNEEIFIGGDSGRVSIINQRNKEITEDTIPNVFRHVSDIKANKSGIFAVVNGELYFKKNQILESNMQFIGQEKLNIYPTISRNIIYIGDLVKNSSYTIKIINLDGTTVYIDNISYTTDPLIIKIDDLNNGIYILEVLSFEDRKSALFIKQ